MNLLKLRIYEREGLLSLLEFLTRWEPLHPLDISNTSFYLRALSAILKGHPIPPPDSNPVFCICRKPADDSEETQHWIACDYCSEWMHLNCIGLTPEKQDLLDYYFCPNCVDIVPELFLKNLKAKRIFRNSEKSPSKKGNMKKEKSTDQIMKQEDGESGGTAEWNPSTLCVKIKLSRPPEGGEPQNVKRRKVETP